MDEPEVENVYELICPGCGGTVNDSDVSCPTCGMSFLSCPNCNGSIGQHDSKCGHCGYLISEIKNDVQHTAKEKREVSRLVSKFRELMAAADEMEMAEMDPRKEVKEKFYQPNINLIQSFMVLFLFIVSIGILLNFTIYKEIWYENFTAFNMFLMGITSIGIIIGLAIILTAEPESPKRLYRSKLRTAAGIIGGIVGFISFIVLTLWGNSLGTTNVLLSVLLFIGTVCLILMSPTISNRDAVGLWVVSTGFLLILLVPVHEALGPFQTDFRSLPWAVGNEILFVVGIIIFGAGYIYLRMNTSYLVIWVLGAIVLFLVPFHETVNIISSTNYEPWDHMMAMIGITVSALGAVGFLVKKSQYDMMAVHLDKGNQLLISRNSGASLVEYEAALAIAVKADISTEYATPWFSVGNAMAMEGRPGEAVSNYDVALKIEPEDANILTNKGNCLCQLNRPLDALECYSKALEINADHVDAQYHKGVVEKLLGKLELAEISLEKVIKISPNHIGGIIQLAQTKSLLGKNFRALELLENATAYHPNEARLPIEIAKIYLSQGDLVRSERGLEPAKTIEPNNLHSIFLEAKIAFYREDYEKSYALLEGIKSIEKEDTEYVMLWVKILMKKEKYQTARHVLEEAMKHHSAKAELLPLTALCYRTILHEKRQLDWCHDVLGDDIDVAMISFINGNADGVSDVLAAVNQNTNAFFDYANLRREFCQIEQREWAIKIHETLLNGNYDDLAGMMVISIFLDMEWHREKAITYYRKVIQNSKGISDSVSLPDAISFFEEVISRDENNLDAYVGKMRALLELRRYEDVLTAAEHALEIFTDNVEISTLMAEALLKMGKVEESVSILELCVEHDPKYIDAWLNLGNALVKSDNLYNAVNCYNRALALDHNFLPAIRNRNITLNAIANRGLIDEFDKR